MLIEVLIPQMNATQDIPVIGDGGGLAARNCTPPFLIQMDQPLLHLPVGEFLACARSRVGSGQMKERGF